MNLCGVYTSLTIKILQSLYENNFKNCIPLFLFYIQLLSGCNTIDPPYSNSKLTLSFEEASCTEAWLSLKAEGINLPAEIKITHTEFNGNTGSQISILTTQDSLLYIDSLLPNKSYRIQVNINYPESSIEDRVSSNEITFTTLDTTSHNFTWQSWTFGGEAGSCSLYDVAIIDENNIWAVGEIYLKDSLGNPDPQAYNAVHWNGSNWELLRIQFYTVCGQTNKTSYPAKSIFAFSKNEICIAMDGDQIAKLENGIQTAIQCLPWSFSIQKIWGESSKEFYVVGNNGNIALYQHGVWKKLQTTTALNIYDIWGQATDKEDEILCIASNQFIDEGNNLLQIKGTEVITINSLGLSWALNTIWFISERKYFIGGDGLYYAKCLDENWIRDNNIPPFYKTGIRGTGFNDIVIVGAFGLILHYNGMTYKNFQNSIQGSYGRVDMKNNIICCTGGLNDGQAIITVGKR